MDWLAGRHILLLRESEMGHLDSEQHARVPWLFCVSRLISSSSPPSSWHSGAFPPPAPIPALYHPLSCPSEPLSAILFDWSLTCNVPLSATGEASCWKGQNIYNKVSKASERRVREEGGTAVGGGVIKRRLHEKSLNIFWDIEIIYCKQLDLVERSEERSHTWFNNTDLYTLTSLTLLPNHSPSIYIRAKQCWQHNTHISKTYCLYAHSHISVSSFVSIVVAYDLLRLLS